MGMFDTLYVNTHMLPISDEDKLKIGDTAECQTKAFDNVLTEIYITDNGELQISKWNYTEVPESERPYPDDKGILGLFGSLKRENEVIETIPYHGIFNFYIYNDDIDKNFYVKFTDGKLEWIKENI